MKRILPFPRGRMKMTKVWNDDEQPRWTFIGVGPRLDKIYAFDNEGNAYFSDQALSHFTRVVEETGMLQKEAPLTKRESSND